MTNKPNIWKGKAWAYWYDCSARWHGEGTWDGEPLTYRARIRAFVAGRWVRVSVTVRPVGVCNKQGGHRK